MKFDVRIVPHTKQRYDTSGDYYLGRTGNLHIIVSDLGNRQYELLIALHELIEATLCLNRNISIDAIDTFDFAWTPHGGLTEPGDDPTCPYYREHQFATAMERALAQQLNVDWQAYSAAVEALDYQPDRPQDTPQVAE
jgi:hypothetical protein